MELIHYMLVALDLQCSGSLRGLAEFGSGNLMDDFLQAASTERPPSNEMLSKISAYRVLMHDQLFHSRKTHEVLIPCESIHLVGVDKALRKFAFPSKRA